MTHLPRLVKTIRVEMDPRSTSNAVFPQGMTHMVSSSLTLAASSNLSFRNPTSSRSSGVSAGKDRTWDRCYDFKNIFAEFFDEKNWRFSLKTKVNYAKF
jgi:hypothetical protein